MQAILIEILPVQAFLVQKSLVQEVKVGKLINFQLVDEGDAQRK